MPGSDQSSPPRENAPGPNRCGVCHLIDQRGVAGTTSKTSRPAADVRGSQLYHYFPDKDDLVQAVLDYQADTAVNNRRQAGFGNIARLRAWRGSAPLRGRRVAWS